MVIDVKKKKKRLAERNFGVGLNFIASSDTFYMVLEHALNLFEL